MEKKNRQSEIVNNRIPFECYCSIVCCDRNNWHSDTAYSLSESYNVYPDYENSLSAAVAQKACSTIKRMKHLQRNCVRGTRWRFRREAACNAGENLVIKKRLAAELRARHSLGVSA